MFLYSFIAAIFRWLAGRCHALRAGLTHRHRRKGRRPAAKCKPARKPRSGGKPKPDWAVKEILTAWDQGCTSYRQLAHEFNRRHGHRGVSICHNTVYVWVRKYRSEMLAVQKATRNRVPRHAPANLRWCVDATGRHDDNGQRHFIFGIVDYGSRLCVELKRMAEQTSAALLRAILLVVDTYGKPARIRTDNAPVFTSGEFRAGLKAAGIEHELSEPGKPWQNGRIERFFGTLKGKLRLLPMLCDGVELDGLLKQFRHWYNRIRPHQHLCGWTPAEVWEGVNPYLRKPKAVQAFSAWGGLLNGEYLLR